MRNLTAAGFIACAFGLGAFQATGRLGVFGAVNLVLGAGALLVAGVYRLRRLRGQGSPQARRVIAVGAASVVAAAALAVGLERGAHWLDVRLDWTSEGRYELAPATVRALSELCGPVELLLFHDPLDPRIRRTRLLLQTMAREGQVQVREYDLESSPDEVDEYGVGSSNTVIIVAGDDWEHVGRPLEGPLYEGLYRLCAPRNGVIALLRGEGEGDPQRDHDLGFSGLSAALATEGYELRSLVSASMREVPEDIDALLVLAPQRPLPRAGLETLARYLAGGGRLIALLEPGTVTGLEALLGSWGLGTDDRVLVDPASGVAEGFADGLCPVAYNYEEHPATTGLDPNRMTFFCGVRSFQLRKPQVDDQLRAVVQASSSSWLSAQPGVATQRSGSIAHSGEPQNYHPIAVAARYQRDAVETRIFAVGDSDFARNRFLRTLYNLDLLLNGVHWATAREPSITLRPKIGTAIQFPLPVQDSLEMLYGAGLLVPELLLLAGAIVWLRQRGG